MTPKSKGYFAKAIADHLGIPPIRGKAGPWMSTEGTVLGAWVQAVSERLDVPYTGKVQTMAAMVQRLGEIWDADSMGSENTPSKGGGNISRPGLEALLRGLQHQAAASRRRQVSRDGPAYDPPEPHQAQDDVELPAIRIRRGQPRFRADLLRAYAGRCAFTGTDATSTLEAAHIRPYGEGGSYDINNGILLRADIHTLFDLCLLTIEANTLEILLHPELLETTYAGELEGHTVSVPHNPRDRPDRDALLAHRRRCEF